jgi:cytochrome c peroxidase
MHFLLVYTFAMRGFVALLLLGAVFCAQAQNGFTESEVRAVLRHGPWPPPLKADPSNRLSGQADAIAFGRRLFFEPRLSGPGSVLCATCHAPGKAFQDGKPRAFGLAQVDRNTPTLLNVRFSRWFGWDGGHDSLWSQSVRPLLESREMAATPAHIKQVVSKLFLTDYRGVFHEEPADAQTVLVNVGKALAAYQETLISGRTPFDAFRDLLAADAAGKSGYPLAAQRGLKVFVGKALAAYQETLVTGRTPFDEFRDALAKTPQKKTNYPLAAQRGLKVFVGKGNCASCHSGPSFTSGGFAYGVTAFTASTGHDDGGRADGIRKLRGDPLNLLGKYNDDPSRSTADATRRAEPQKNDFGAFRVPSLRNAAETAPYMHDGSLPTLREAVRHAADGLSLTESEAADLVAFLETLSPKP